MSEGGKPYTRLIGTVPSSTSLSVLFLRVFDLCFMFFTLLDTQSLMKLKRPATTKTGVPRARAQGLWELVSRGRQQSF